MESPAIGGSRRSKRVNENRAVPILGFALGLVALVVVSVAVLLNVLQSWAESQLTSLLAYRVEIAKLHLNVFAGRVELDDVRVRSRESDSDIMVIRQINADLDLLPLLQRHLSLTQLEFVSPVVHLIRISESAWNLSDIGGRGSASDSTPRTVVVVKLLSLRDGLLIMDDRSVIPMRNERLSDIHLTMRGLSTSSLEPAKIHGSATINGSGSINIEGEATADVASGSIKVELGELPLATFQKYITWPVLVRGLLNAQLSVTWPGHGDSPARITGSLKGLDIEVLSPPQLLARAANVEISHGEVAWPDRIAMERLVMNQPEIWIHRTEQGHIVGLESKETDRPDPMPVSGMKDKETGAADAPVEWSIGRILVQNGAVHFEDRSITPSYSDSLQNLQLTIDDFVTQPRHAATISGQSDLASGGSLDFNGQAALFGPTPGASLKASLHRLVVPSTNPYLERSISHFTTDGTLTSIVDFKLKGDRLDVISDVTFSDLHVEPVRNSTDRTVQDRIGLPLKLLIALLKDHAGRIVITFPMSGPWADPTFDWTDAIWTTIRNTVVKLITLPIRSLGSLLKDDRRTDELALDPVRFAPGSSTMGQEMERRLHDVARLLRSTNRIMLHITPILSATDLKALQQLPRESWPVPDIDTPETARHLLAVRRAFIVAARLAALEKLPASRIPVGIPQVDRSERDTGRVDLRLQYLK